MGSRWLPWSRFRRCRVPRGYAYRGLGYRGLAYRGYGYRGLGYRGRAYRGYGFRGLGYRGLGYRGLAYRGHGYGGPGYDAYGYRGIGYGYAGYGYALGTAVVASTLSIPRSITDIQVADADLRHTDSSSILPPARGRRCGARPRDVDSEASAAKSALPWSVEGRRLTLANGRGALVYRPTCI